MKRLQILVTLPQAKALKRLSKDTGLAVGEHVRRAIDAYDPERPPAARSPEPVAKRKKGGKKR